MVTTALLVDDEPLAVETLEGHCARDGRLQVVGAAHDGDTALAMVAELRPDITFLDIGIPGLSGLGIASRLHTFPSPPLIVFVTAFDHHAAEAFDLAVIDYVLKPVRAERFRRAVDRVIETLARRGSVPVTQPSDLWLPRRGTVVRVPLASIVRIEAERDYVRVITHGESFFLRATISSVEARLTPCHFLRIHRSTIIATNEVAACRHVGNGAWAVVDRSGNAHPIGRSYLETAREALGIIAGDLESYS